MVKKVVKITIDKTGVYKMEAVEGFAGTSCTEQTKGLELILGGAEIGEGKTDDYYKPDDSPVSIDIFQ